MAPWTPFHARLHQTLRQRQLLPMGCSALIAVSGGQDSLALLALLRDLQPKWNWQLAIAHCDHRWRTDSAVNAAHVLDIAHQWGMSAYCETAQFPPATEAAARQWRYQVFTHLAQTHGYAHVVTGHTASDRAETLLYNLARGSGAEGLQALGWQRDLGFGIALVRPMLDFTRSDTAQICEALQLPVWEDTTNQDRRYIRNRIRLEVLPYLSQHLNAQAETHLAQTAEVLAAEVAYLEQEAIAHYAQVIDAQAKPPVRLNRVVLRAVPLALQRRVLRHWASQHLGTPINFEQTEKLVSLLSAPNRTQTDSFPGGAIAQVHQDWLQWVLPDA
jgi:tRNA(Ile)-lysidine synthase